MVDVPKIGICSNLPTRNIALVCGPTLYISEDCGSPERSYPPWKTRLQSQTHNVWNVVKHFPFGLYKFPNLTGINWLCLLLLQPTIFKRKHSSADVGCFSSSFFAIPCRYENSSKSLKGNSVGQYPICFIHNRYPAIQTTQPNNCPLMQM